MEGAFRWSADRVRVTVQFGRCSQRNHLWAERYDRDLKDIFALQDGITIKVLTATQVELTLGEQALGVEKYFKGKQGLDCYLKYLEARKYNQAIISMPTERPGGLPRKLLRCVQRMQRLCTPGMGTPDGVLGRLREIPSGFYWEGIEIVKKAITMDDS